MSQGWSKIFNRINWLNRPSTNTPLNATNLNAGDSAIDKLDDRIITLDTVKADMQVVNGMVADVLLNESNGVLTITYKNGSTKVYDTNLEKIATNFTYDYSTQRLVLTLSDGTTQYVDMSALITQYEFKDSTTIAFSVDSTGKVSASVKNGSITDSMLETGYLANITAQATKAESMANSATTSSNSAYNNAKLSQSYAIGGSGIREGEDTDNAMYYYEQAKKTDIGQISSEVAELNSNLDGLENDCLTLQNTPLKYGLYLGDTGNFIDYGVYKCSEYHEITPNTPIKLELNTDNDDWGLLFYDENKTYLGRSNSVFITSGKSIETTTPTNAKYATINVHLYNGNFPIPKLYTTKIGNVVSNLNESLEDYGLVNVFDGQWLQGGYIADGTYNSNYSYIICNKNKIPCNSGDLVEIKYASQVSWISTRFYDASGTVTEYKDESNVSNVSYKVPANTVALTFNIQYGSNESVTPNSALDCIVYVNNAIEQIKNDLYKSLNYGTVDIFTAIKNYDETVTPGVTISFVVQTQTITYSVNGFKYINGYSSYMAQSYENGSIYHVRCYNGVWSYNQLAYTS